MVDDRLILGVNPWLKPLKFALSITIYVWTVAWFLGGVSEAAPRAARFISVGTSAAMLVEIACIVLQSWRGVTSHFNDATPFDGAVFGFMGVMIAFNTLLAAGLLVLYVVVSTALPAPYVWGVRLGLVIFLLGSAVGSMMVSRRAHAVGVPDGGPGLPVVNWSTEGGDLRAAHALGLHALQVLPLAASGLGMLRRVTAGQQTRAVFLLALVYVLTWALALYHALLGRPLVPS